VRKDADADPLEQYVWDGRYVHSPCLRWRDGNTDGDLDDEGDSVLYYANDANFNVTALVDASDGSVVERVVYDPYGRPTFYDGSWENPSSTSAYANEVLFTGHRRDPETGLYVTLYRIYHPTLGRWLQRDPGGYGDGMGLYEYVQCSPVDRVDSFGCEAEVKFEENPKPTDDKPDPQWVSQEELDKSVTEEDKRLGMDHPGGLADPYVDILPPGIASFKKPCCYCWFTGTTRVIANYVFYLPERLKDPQTDKTKAERARNEAHERAHLKEDFAIPFGKKEYRDAVRKEVKEHDSKAKAYQLYTYNAVHPDTGEMKTLKIYSQQSCERECRRTLHRVILDVLKPMFEEYERLANERDERDYRAAYRKRAKQ